MTDIVTRLRTWVHAVDAVSASDLMEEAAAEVARLRTVCECYAHSSAAACREIASLRQASTQESVCPHVVGTTTKYCSLTPLTLTDEEREAVEAAVGIIDRYEEDMDGFPSGAAATLRSLLERTK